MNKYRLIELQNFNKISLRLPVNVMIILAENGKWFPLIGNLVNLHDLIANFLIGENPELYIGHPFTLKVDEVTFTNDSIKIEVYGNGNFVFYMAEEFTWREPNLSDIKFRIKSDADCWYIGNKDRIKSLGLYSEIYKAMLS